MLTFKLCIAQLTRSTNIGVAICGIILVTENIEDTSALEYFRAIMRSHILKTTTKGREDYVERESGRLWATWTRKDDIYVTPLGQDERRQRTSNLTRGHEFSARNRREERIEMYTVILRTRTDVAGRAFVRNPRARKWLRLTVRPLEGILRPLPVARHGAVRSRSNRKRGRARRWRSR